MTCFDHFDDCYSTEKLRKFKAASLEVLIQTIGTIDDEVEDKFQECPIYLEFVGDKLSKRAIAAIVISALVVCAVIFGYVYWRLKRSRQSRLHSYNQAVAADNFQLQ